MQFTRKTVRSRPGLTQEDALASLQESPMFRPGTRIASIKLRGNVWVAALDIPKTAGDFPPKSDDSGSDDSAPAGPPEEGSDSDGGDSDSSDSGESGPPKPEGEGGDKPGEPKKLSGDEAIVQLLTEILHALKGGPATDALGGPDDMGPGAGGPPAPAPHGGPAGPGGPPKGGPGFPGAPGSKLKPGEVPNKPGVTPVGAPAFASTRTAFGEMTPGSVPNPAQHTPGGACPTCGGPVGPDGSCPTCMGGGVASGGTAPAPASTLSPLAARIAAVAGKKATLPISAPEGVSIKEAKAVLEPIAAQYGYRVAQVKYVDNRPRFLLTTR